jgi:hypothetical protein
VIALGETITVFGIVIEGTANGQVTIELSGTSTAKMLLSVLANSTTVMNIPFVADAGIQVTTPASVTCTVFHSNAGA